MVMEAPGASDAVVQVTVPRAATGGAVHDAPEGPVTLTCRKVEEEEYQSSLTVTA
jgi:hypothetical protein